MKCWRQILGVCVFAVLSSLLHESAQSHDTWHLRGLGPNNYYGYGSTVTYHSIHASPPYFSVHPPVYYGHVQPRNYGASPYPYRANRSRSTASSVATRVPSGWEMRLGTGPRIPNPYFVAAESTVSDKKGAQDGNEQLDSDSTISVDQPDPRQAAIKKASARKTNAAKARSKKARDKKARDKKASAKKR